mmetsp:Transcript_11007/g.29308  ORF Transcript_11007/g.29308 Transcript_11007/m.29308 type:complete len:210 (-) Transcript_11007:83-712(-)
MKSLQAQCPRPCLHHAEYLEQNCCPTATLTVAGCQSMGLSMTSPSICQFIQEVSHSCYHTREGMRALRSMQLAIHVKRGPGWMRCCALALRLTRRLSFQTMPRGVALCRMTSCKNRRAPETSPLRQCKYSLRLVGLSCCTPFLISAAWHQSSSARRSVQCWPSVCWGSFLLRRHGRCLLACRLGDHFCFCKQVVACALWHSQSRYCSCP